MDGRSQTHERKRGFQLSGPDLWSSHGSALSLTESHSRARCRLPCPSRLLRPKAGFDRAASSFVPLDDAGDERVLSLRFARQGLFQHLDDVAWRQQFEARLAGHALFDDEQHRQHDDRDVVMPGSPAQRLIVGQAALALGVFEGALDPVAVPCICASRSNGVSAGAFDRLYLIVLTDLTSRRTIRCQHRARASSPSQTQTRRCAISTCNWPRVQSRRTQRVQSCGGIPLASSSTMTGVVAGCCFFDGRRGPAPARERAGPVLGPNPLVAMHVGDENLACVVHRPQESRFFAVAGVDSHVGEPHPPLARPAHDVEACWLSMSSCAPPRDPGRSQRAGSSTQRFGR